MTFAIWIVLMFSLAVLCVISITLSQIREVLQDIATVLRAGTIIDQLNLSINEIRKGLK